MLLPLFFVVCACFLLRFLFALVRDEREAKRRDAVRRHEASGRR